MPEFNTRIMTVEQLVEIVGEAVIGTTSGLRAQKAQAELNRRVIEALNSSKESTVKSNKTIIFLTLVLVVLTIVLVVDAVPNPFKFGKSEAAIARDFDCAKYARENFPEYMKSEFTDVMQTEYRYSQSLNTCLAYFQMKGDYDSRNVVDLYSSQNILQYYENCTDVQGELVDGKPDDCLTLPEFLKQKNLLD